jgi:hypothetical protein
MIGYRGMILGGEMIDMIIEGALAIIPSTLHQSDILCQIKRYYSDEGRETCNHKKHLGSSTVRGKIPKEIYPFPLMSKGER